jgi:carbonic anhydrase
MQCATSTFRTRLSFAALGCALLAVPGWANEPAKSDAATADTASADAHGPSANKGRPTPEQALQQLIDGNARFVAGHPEHPNQSVARRVEVAAGQTPFAVIVTCSDSRVAPELYFDQGLGDLFVIRDAGNTLNDHVIGSIEYAVEHLKSSIVIVVGHEKCGAVAAAVAGGKNPGRIPTIVEAIRPAVLETRNQAGDKTDNAVRGNARRVAKALAATGPILSHAVLSGEIKIFAARYDLTSGRVELLP